MFSLAVECFHCSYIVRIDINVGTSDHPNRHLFDAGPGYDESNDFPVCARSSFERLRAELA
jgi:hypothetical protein